MPDPGGRLHAILRNNGQSGDLVDARAGRGFRARLRHLGFAGHDVAPQRGGGRLAQGGRRRLVRPGHRGACDWAGRAPGAARAIRGDLAELRVYDRQLDEAERQRVEAELRAAWFEPAGAEAARE